MKMKSIAAFVICMASTPLLFAESPAQRGASTKERLLEAELSAVVTVYEKAQVLKLEAELKRHLLSESSDKSDEAEVVALRKRIAALDVVIGKLRDTATHNEAELLSFLAERSDAATEQQSVRLYKLPPSAKNITEGWYAVLINKALESADLQTLERHHVERGPDWLRVKAAPDQMNVVDRVISPRDDATTDARSVRIYKLNQLDENLTEGTFAKLFNTALEGAGLKMLRSPEHIERGSGWLKVNATQDQWDIVNRVMSSRHE